MSKSNKLFKWVNYNENNNSNTYGSDSDTDDSNGYTTINKDVFSSILRHPYIEHIKENDKIDIYKTNNERKYWVIYRLKTYNEVNHVVEFYVLNDFLSSTTNTDNVDSELQSIYGDKRIKGNILFKGNRYSFVQVRNNTDTSNWLNIWDILVNKHYFGNKICDNVIDFFKGCGEVSNLMIGTTICLKPITLYTNIEERFYEYITKTKSIQYCQSETESLIHLRNFKEGDNIRTICFVDDREIGDSIHELEYNDYIVKNVVGEEIGEIEWVFKNNNALFSFVK